MCLTEDEVDTNVYYRSNSMAGRQLPPEPEPYEELNVANLKERRQVDDPGRDNNYIQIISG